MKEMERSLLTQFDHLIVLDTETTGIRHKSDEIIELAALRTSRKALGRADEELDMLIRVSPGRRLPSMIEKLTGISEEMLARDGISKEEACRRFAKLLREEKLLIAAYNAQFDLCFLYHFLQQFGCAELLCGVKFLDAMTVYKDRREYPHKLQNAIEAYGVSIQNTHRAIDDAKATLALLSALERERPDLNNYVNLFGYNPKYGISGPKISSVNYQPQPYELGQRLYECKVVTN